MVRGREAPERGQGGAEARAPRAGCLLAARGHVRCTCGMFAHRWGLDTQDAGKLHASLWFCTACGAVICIKLFQPINGLHSRSTKTADKQPNSRLRIDASSDTATNSKHKCRSSARRLQIASNSCLRSALSCPPSMHPECHRMCSILIAPHISWHQITFTRAQADIADRGRKEASSPASLQGRGTPKTGPMLAPSVAYGSQQAQRDALR